MSLFENNSNWRKNKISSIVRLMKDRYEKTMEKWIPIQVIEKKDVFYIIYAENGNLGSTFHVHWYEYRLSTGTDWKTTHLKTLHWFKDGNDALKWLIGELTLGKIINGIPIDILDIYSFSSIDN